jgi:hypothetical protein
MRSVYLTELKLIRHLRGAFDSRTIREIEERGDAIAARIAAALDLRTVKAKDNLSFILPGDLEDFEGSVEAIAFMTRAMASEMAAKQTSEDLAEEIRTGIDFWFEIYELCPESDEDTRLEKIAGRSFDRQVLRNLNRDIEDFAWEVDEAIASDGHPSSVENHLKRFRTAKELTARVSVCEMIGLDVTAQRQAIEELTAQLGKEVEAKKEDRYP